MLWYKSFSVLDGLAGRTWRWFLPTRIDDNGRSRALSGTFFFDRGRTLLRGPGVATITTTTTTSSSSTTAHSSPASSGSGLLHGSNVGLSVGLEWS